MIVRSFKDIEGTDRDVTAETGTWRSKRIILAKEGVGFSLHETVFDRVAVPESARLGDEGQGWSIVRQVMHNERIGQPRYTLSMRALDRAVSRLKDKGRFGGQGGKIGVAPHVAADRQHGLGPQQRQRIEQATAGFQRGRAFVHVADAQTPARAVAQCVGKLFGEVRGVDRHVVHADRGELLQMPHDQRLATRHQQGLGRAFGEWTHALAQPGGEDQGVPHDPPLRRRSFVVIPAFAHCCMEYEIRSAGSRHDRFLL